MNPTPFQSLSVIGGGAWGTALACLSAGNGIETTIWARETEVVTSINEARENRTYLPGVKLHAALKATHDIAAAGKSNAFLFAVPVQFARAALASLARHAPRQAAIAFCSKGVERDSGMRLTEVLAEVWPEAIPAVLSGPSFARDVANGLPTAITLAAANKELGERWAASIRAPHFRPYLSDDLVGAELGGAVKNVLAIAAGAVAGKGLGESAHAALIARGFAEFQRLGVALGARAETMAGLSGLGDLILTASSQQSRNMSLGFELGRGRRLDEILAARNSVSEGVATAPAIVEIARKVNVELPICTAVADLVSGARSLDDIIASLLARPLREEGR